MDSSRRGSRDNLSEISQPIRSYDPSSEPTQPPVAMPRPRTQTAEQPVFTYSQPAVHTRVDYSNDGYSTDHSPKPVSSPEHSDEQHQPTYSPRVADSQLYQPTAAPYEPSGGARYQPQRDPPTNEQHPTNEDYQPATARYQPRGESYTPAATQYQPRTQPYQTRVEPSRPTAEQYQPAAMRPAPRGAALPDDNDPNEHAYVNTSRLHKPPEVEKAPSEASVDLAELKRQELYNQKRPTRPGPSVPAQAARPQARPGPRSNLSVPSSHRNNELPPGYNTATRNDRPSVRARPTNPMSDQQYSGYPNPSYSLGKRDSLSTMDTKSVDSFDTESDYSMSKPPLSYRPYDHVRQYSDEKKPFETDIDSMYSEDQADNAPLYRPRSGARTYAPSPLVRQSPAPGYDSDTSSQRGYYQQNRANLQREAELSPQGAYGYRVPNAETDIDAMSEMSDWNRQGPPVETDF